MINSIFDLREHGFIEYYNHDTAVAYKKGDLEVIDDLKTGYVVKKKTFIKLTTEDFKEVIKFLEKQKVI
jgi:hypothetical protein